jgi:hypothetical protein
MVQADKAAFLSSNKSVPIPVEAQKRKITEEKTQRIK